MGGDYAGKAMEAWMVETICARCEYGEREPLEGMKCAHCDKRDALDYLLGVAEELGVEVRPVERAAE